MRTKHLEQVKLDAKLQQLSASWPFVKMVRSFFKHLQFNREKLMKHLSKARLRRKTKSFYSWRIRIASERMWQYRQQFHELSPEIERVSVLQREMATERELLVEELRRKEALIEQFAKRVEDCEYAERRYELRSEGL